MVILVTAMGMEMLKVVLVVMARSLRQLADKLRIIVNIRVCVYEKVYFGRAEVNGKNNILSTDFCFKNFFV